MTQNREIISSKAWADKSLNAIASNAKKLDIGRINGWTNLVSIF